MKKIVYPILVLIFFANSYTQDQIVQSTASAEMFAEKASSAWTRSSREEAFESLKKIDLSFSLSGWKIVLEKSNEAAFKIEAINRISQSKDKKDLNSIINQLDSRFSEVRTAAIAVLKRIGDDRVYPKILIMSQNENPVFRVYAAEALTSMYDKRFLPIVAEMVKDKNKSIRLMIIRLIAKNRITEQLNNLKTIAIQDDDYEVIIESMNALSSFGDSSSSYIYIKLLSHSDYNVRKTAAEKIERYRISSAASALNEQLERETDDYLKDFYISLLVSFRSSFIRGIELTALKDSSARLRIKAVASLGILRSDRSAGVLIQTLSDEDYRVRSEACNSLAIINARSSCQKMTAMVKNEKNIFVRSAALYALEKIRDKSTIIPLYDILAEEKDEVFRMLLNNTLRNMVEKTI